MNKEFKDYLTKNKKFTEYNISLTGNDTTKALIAEHTDAVNDYDAVFLFREESDITEIWIQKQIDITNRLEILERINLVNNPPLKLLKQF